MKSIGVILSVSGLGLVSACGSSERASGSERDVAAPGSSERDDTVPDGATDVPAGGTDAPATASEPGDVNSGGDASGATSIDGTEGRGDSPEAGLDLGESDGGESDLAESDSGGLAGHEQEGGTGEPDDTSSGSGVVDAPSGMHCAPGEVNTAFDFGSSCREARFEHGLPNPQNVGILDFALPAPTVAGERFALSVRHDGGGPVDIEIWGADGECGVARELLWWGPLVDGTQCSEFTPSAEYPHLFYVYRPRGEGNYVSARLEVAVCRGGSCPGGVDGQGLEPGGPSLIGPPLTYEYGGGLANPHGYDLTIGGQGRFWLVRAGSRQPKGTPNPLARGVFRMPPDDPFGDAWYCVGEGSSLTESAEETNRLTLSLKNLTRLPVCPLGDGSASFSTEALTAEITSSFSLLAGSELRTNARRCDGPFCSFRFSSALHIRRFYLRAAASVGTPTPTSTPTDVSEAFIVVQVNDPATLFLTCASSGTISYGHQGTTHVELGQMSETLRCPGEPIADDELEFTTF